VREFLEKNYDESMDAKKTLKLAVAALLEVVESAQNIEISMMTGPGKAEMVDEAVIKSVIEEIEKEKEDAKK